VHEHMLVTTYLNVFIRGDYILFTLWTPWNNCFYFWRKL